MTSYERNRDYILKYQRENENYKAYRREYEREYRKTNRIKLNYNSWKSVKGKVKPVEEINYLLKRLLK